MDLHEKIRSIPTLPGCYLYKNAEGVVIYVGKAKNLRARVRSYFLEAAQANAKTGSLMREAVDIEYITVGNEREALALEDSLIKQRQPRYNILLRDDKTYPYIQLTIEGPLPQGVCDAAAAPGRLGLLWTVLSQQPGVSAGGADPSQFSDSKLLGGPVSIPSARMPAVLHQAMPGALRRGADHSGDV